MAMIPEYLFPIHPYSLKNIDSAKDWSCGWCDQENLNGGWAPNFVAKEMRPLTITMDVMENVSEATCHYNTIFTFPNGVMIVLKSWVNWSGSTYTKSLKIVLKYQDHEFTDAELTEMGFNASIIKDFGISANNIIFSPAGSSHDIEAQGVIFLCAQYYPVQGVENTTPCKALQFCVYMPGVAMPVGFENLYMLFKPYENVKTNIRAIISDTGYTGYPSDFVSNIITQDPPPFSLVDLDAINANAKNWGNHSDDPVIQKDPPTPEQDTSGTGGGDGTYDPTSDPIDFPDVPTGGAITSGMLKAFLVSTGNLQALQNKLWNISAFDIATQFQKLVNEPMQCMVSLHALPVLPATVGTAEHIKLGSFDTEVSANRINENWHVVDCGTLNIGKFWGSALDYAPYTQCEIFLPFIGIRSLKIEDVVNTTLHIKYYVDLLNGQCIAFIKCGQSVLYTYTGNCIEHIPVMSQSSDLLKNNIAAVGAVGVGVATGMSAAAVAGAAAGAINSATAKNHVQRSGDVAGSSGIMGEFEPYLILHRPKQSLAKNYNKFKGYPCNITYLLSSLSGYTEVQHIHLTDINSATDAELNEIETLLKSGVII